MVFSFFGRRALSLAVVSLLASSALGEVFEQLNAVPDGWKYSHTPQADQPIRLQISLKQQNVAGFEQALLDMSTPGHPNYGKHFQSHDEMKAMLAPSDASVNAVREWLDANGVTDVQQDADWINFRTTVGVANTLLDADFKWYASYGGLVTRLRTLQYSLPESVAANINTVQPTTRFGHVHPNRATLHKLPMIKSTPNFNFTSCNSLINPQCLKHLYNIGDYQADPESGSKIAFASFLEEYARYSDLELFEKNLAPYALGQNFSVVAFNGGLNDQNSTDDSGEANLDAQYVMGIASPLPVTEFSTGGRGPLVPDLTQPSLPGSNEPYLEFLQGVLKLDQADLPQVISISYGENEQTIPPKYAETVCNLLAQVGSRGVSVLFASGDSGVGAGCVTNDGTNRTHFPPQFPAGCPWVTAVGATHKVEPEEAAFFSSGGFSDIWPRPLYQELAVQSYLGKLGNKYEGLFNSRGRAFPDVSAQGMEFAVYDKGDLNLYYGTSCSTPVFSAVVSLLNDARLRIHKPPLGFLNPWLYTVGLAGLNDIVEGGSDGCDGSSGGPVIPYASWNATRGWDPVTGLGTPDFARLRNLALLF